MLNWNKNKKLFKGACLRYDAEDQILIATPFKGGIDCWNGGDWLVILAPVCLFVLAILFFFIQRQVKNKEKMFDLELEKYHFYVKYKKMEKGFGRK